MRTLVVILALLAGPALSPSVYAAGGPDPAPMGRAADPDYVNGRKAIDAKDYKAAVDYFTRVAARDPGNADAQNELGYSYRKSGNIDMAFKHYNEALRLDPSHKGALEYMGEAYLMVDNLPKAEENLARLDKACFFSCEEYRDLKKAIQEYKQRKSK